MFANAQMLPRVKAFNVYWDLHFPVHAACELILKYEEPKFQVLRNLKPLNLDDAISNAINDKAKSYDDKNEAEAYKDAKQHVIQNIHEQINKHARQKVGLMCTAARTGRRTDRSESVMCCRPRSRCRRQHQRCRHSGR